MSGYVYGGTGFDIHAPEEATTAMCGTPAGYQRHHLHGTQPCSPCREANNTYKRAERVRKPRKTWTPDRCGTLAGWNAHQRYGVPVCDPCRAAQVAYQIDYRARKRAA